MLDSLTALVTLTAMEIVLGLDNIIFIAILVARLPNEAQTRIRRLGILLAVVIRIGLLFSLSWIMSLTRPLVSVMGVEISGRSLILIAGGLFLFFKATLEIHEKLEGEVSTQPGQSPSARGKPGSILAQILVLDIVFSLDSVITAVGMAQLLSIMIAAMLLSTLVMLFSAGAIGGFVSKHPTLKILALSFLLLIGLTLVIEGTGGHVSKGYIYFAMAFSLGVEVLNIRYRKKTTPVQLRSSAP